MLPVAVFPNEPQAQGGTPEGKLERKIGDNGAKSTKIGGAEGRFVARKICLQNWLSGLTVPQR